MASYQRIARWISAVFSEYRRVPNAPKVLEGTGKVADPITSNRHMLPRWSHFGNELSNFSATSIGWKVAQLKLAFRNFF